MSLYIFAVHNTGYCGYIKACLFSYIFENHRLEIGFIAIYEIFMLVIYDSLHGTRKSIVTLLDSLNEPLR